MQKHQSTFWYHFSVVVMSEVPRTYVQMFRFFFSGSGSWATIFLLVSFLTGKSIAGWTLCDIFIFSGFFLLRGIFEWLTHAFFYHAKKIPFLGFRIKGDVWRQHMKHHKDPRDLKRILITYKGVSVPPIVFFVFTFVVSSNLSLSFSLALASLMLGAFVELGHLVCHCEIRHRTEFMKRFVLLHRHHHSTDPNSCYGLTSTLGDRAFGTFY